MNKICVFAGTTEGRRLVEFLSGRDVQVTACVATEYGETLIDPAENVRVHAGRLDEAGMEQLLHSEGFDLVIDATHPYAAAATHNIMLACAKAGAQYIRLEREGEEAPGSAVCVPDIASAVEYLNKTTGNILLTTGSKELAAFSGIEDFAKRMFARVLPVEASVAACRESGLLPSHILAMQGPFSVGMNAAMIKSVNAAYVVTKDSGKAGGFEEKAVAAGRAGAELIVIGRPESPVKGRSFGEVLELLEERFGFAARPSVFVIGVGPGTRAGLSFKAQEAIDSADCAIGAARMLELARPDRERFAAVTPDGIAGFIRQHREYSRFAVLMSGDTGFYSGAKKLMPLLDFCDVTVIPGVSSLSYLCAKLGQSYEDIQTISLHGREGSLLPAVRRNRRVFVLAGGENGAGLLIRMLVENGLGGLRVSVGERLGYEDERVLCGKASDLAQARFDALSCLLIENDSPESAACGLPDEAFTRSASDAPTVPMTKSEVRAVAMSKLALKDDSVCWDVGSGTGSVAVEMALAASRGAVYAIEKKPEAIELLKANAVGFGVKNVICVEGEAPAACEELPAPTHAFIGGSSGNMRQIVELLLKKDPGVRIVAAAIALETVAELSKLCKDLRFELSETVCVNVAKARKVGPYSLMTGQNPVYIYTMQGPRKD